MRISKRVSNDLLVIFICSASLLINSYGYQSSNPLLRDFGLIVLLSLLIFSSTENQYSIWFFALPSSWVLKFSFVDYSASTFIVLIILFSYFIRLRNRIVIDPIFWFIFSIFVAFCIVGAHQAKISEIIELFSLFSDIVLVYLIFSTPGLFKLQRGLNFFILGVIVSSIGALVISGFESDDFVNIVNKYETYARFTGTANDPNFSSAIILLAQSFLVLLISQSKRGSLEKKIYIVSIIFLLLPGFLTYSKMYLFVAIMILIYISMYFLSRTDIKKLGTIALVITATLIVISQSPLGEEIINGYRSRFFGVRDINDLTTNRSQIFNQYSTFIFRDSKILLVGDGYYRSGRDLRSRNGIAPLSPHNSFLSFLYSLGIFGLIIFGSLLYRLILLIKSDQIFSGRFIHYLPLMVFVAINFALDFSYEDFFVVFLMLCVSCVVNNWTCNETLSQPPIVPSFKTSQARS